MDLSQPVKAKWPIIALIVLVVGGIGLGVRSMWSDPSKPTPKGNPPPGYLCDQCDKPFTLTRDQYAEQVPDERMMQTDPGAARRPHCPLCQAKHSGWMTVRCPKCDKAYVPPGQGRPGPAKADSPEDICPHCKTDRGEWYRSHRRDKASQG